MRASEFLRAVDYLRKFPDAELKIRYNYQKIDVNNISVTASISTNSPINLELNLEKKKDDLDIFYVYTTDGTTDGYEDYKIED